MKKKEYASILLTAILISFLHISNAGAEDTVRRIVLFQERVTQDAIDQYVENWEFRGAVLVDFVPFINGAILNVPATIQPAELADDHRVASVGGNQKVTLQALVAMGDGAAGDGAAGDGAAGDGAANDPPPEPVSFIDQVDDNVFNGERPWGILHLFNLPYDSYSLTSFFDPDTRPPIVDKAMERRYIKHINIATFDTGVDYTHPKLDNHVEGGIDLVNMTDGIPMDDNGHGTHVAATIVARRTGLARGSKLYAVKVLDRYATGEVATIVRGLQWAVDNDIHVVNMSIAFSDDDPAVRMAVRKAHEAGIVIIGAVGNHSNWEDNDPAAGDGAAGDGAAGDGAAGDGAAGDGAAGDGAAGASGTPANPYPVMYPAAYPEVIGVGAHDHFGDITAFTNTGTAMELTAPGDGIVSANLMAASKYGFCNGTSMATPHVTGAVALMLSLDRNGTISSPDDLREILLNNAEGGKLNLLGALEAIEMRQ